MNVSRSITSHAPPLPPMPGPPPPLPPLPPPTSTNLTPATQVTATGQGRWYFSAESLHMTPSRRDNVSSEDELSYRQQAANFIQDMGQRLQVTQLCINTAIVYMQRFYMFHSFPIFHRNTIAVAALFLAAKVEEQPRKLEHVIKVAHICLRRDQPQLDTRSEQYIEQAQKLVMNENILLQTLGFDVAIDHPHTHVVKCCQLVKASKELAQTSYFMATNSLHLTTMCLRHSPTIVACVCIHLACKWTNYHIPLSTKGKEWFLYVDPNATLELLNKLTEEFLTIFEKCPSRLKKKIMASSQATKEEEDRRARGEISANHYQPDYSRNRVESSSKQPYPQQRVPPQSSNHHPRSSDKPHHYPPHSRSGGGAPPDKAKIPTDRASYEEYKKQQQQRAAAAAQKPSATHTRPTHPPQSSRHAPPSQPIQQRPPPHGSQPPPPHHSKQLHKHGGVHPPPSSSRNSHSSSHNRPPGEKHHKPPPPNQQVPLVQQPPSQPNRYAPQPTAPVQPPIKPPQSSAKIRSIFDIDESPPPKTKPVEVKATPEKKHSSPLKKSNSPTKKHRQSLFSPPSSSAVPVIESMKISNKSLIEEEPKPLVKEPPPAETFGEESSHKKHKKEKKPKKEKKEKKEKKKEKSHKHKHKSKDKDKSAEEDQKLPGIKLKIKPLLPVDDSPKLDPLKISLKNESKKRSRTSESDSSPALKMARVLGTSGDMESIYLKSQHKSTENGK